MASRLVIDSNVFRGLKDDHLPILGRVGLKVSVSETAISEAWARSAFEYRQGMSRLKARKQFFGRAVKFRPYIDPQYPIAPAGSYAVTQLRLGLGENVLLADAIESRDHLAFLPGCWDTISGIGYVDDIWLGHAPVQSAFLDGLDRDLCDLARRDDDIWAEKDEKTREEYAPHRAEWAALPEGEQLEQLRRYTRETWEFSDALAERLDALVSVVAWTLYRSSSGAQMPRKRNDGADLRLLAHLAEDAILVTNDAPLHSKVEASGTYQRPWVVKFDQLASGLPKGPPWKVESPSRAPLWASTD